MKVREVLRVLRDDGWRVVSQRGSHRQLTHPSTPGRVTVVGADNAELHPTTLASIYRQAGLRD